MTAIKPKWEGIRIIAGGNNTREEFMCIECGSPACRIIRQLGDQPYECAKPERKNKIEHIRKELRK